VLRRGPVLGDLEPSGEGEDFGERPFGEHPRAAPDPPRAMKGKALYPEPDETPACDLGDEPRGMP